MASINKIITPSVRLVEEFMSSSQVYAEGLPFEQPDKMILSHSDNHFDLVFTSIPSHSLCGAWDKPLPDVLIHCNEHHMRVLSGKAQFTGSIQYLSPEPQSFNIKIQSLIDASINESEEHFIRIVQPIARENWVHDISTYAYTEGSSWSLGLLEVKLYRGIVHLYPYKSATQQYLITDILFPTTIDEAHKIAFSTSVALGLITTTVNLGEYFFLFGNNPGFEQITGLSYYSLRPTIYGQYRIFTTNLYTVENALKNVPNAEYALHQLYNDQGSVNSGMVDWMYMDVFSNLARSIYENDSLQQASTTIIEASTYPLEYQAGLYCLVIEAITTVLTESDKPVYPMPYDEYEATVKPKLEAVISELESKATLDQTASAIYRKRIKNEINKQTNGDKLKIPFARFGYTLTRLDEKYLNKRNPIFHGQNIATKGTLSDKFDYLLHLSLLLHKLSCILLLKNAGYNGYILNNPVLYGCQQECKAKEDIFLMI